MPLVRSLAAGLCLLLLGSAATAAEAKLTDQEIADGWVLLFDGESTFGWTGKAEVKDGALVVANGETAKFATTLPAGFVEWAPGDLSLTVRYPDGTVVRAKGSAVDAAKQGHESAFAVEVAGQPGKGLKSLKYRPLKSEKLFNGKDLTGWKVFKDEKRAKSVFAVTAAGELSVKNGPGDLQTEKQFDDFLLQLECKTNGTALNSGVFFRCIADQYQNGYELQVQNAFKDNDRTKPADFGTGAIYRRVPARKVVSNDNEWFSMTLLAVGPQIATWVNGYPVVSWKDDRPLNDNPRQGLKTGKGHLSIQGHDPTTDLLFRNLRIAEVK